MHDQLGKNHKALKIVVSSFQTFRHSYPSIFSNGDSKKCIPFKTAHIWENEDFEASSTFPNGVPYTPSKLRSTFTMMLLFFHKFPQHISLKSSMQKS